MFLIGRQKVKHIHVRAVMQAYSLCMDIWAQSVVHTYPLNYHPTLKILTVFQKLDIYELGGKLSNELPQTCTYFCDVKIIRKGKFYFPSLWYQSPKILPLAQIMDTH